MSRYWRKVIRKIARKLAKRFVSKLHEQPRNTPCTINFGGIATSSDSVYITNSGAPGPNFAEIRGIEMDEEVKTETVNKPVKRRSGFSDPEFQKRVAAQGGRAVPAAKRSFSTNPALAAEAGRKGAAKRAENMRKAKESKQQESEGQPKA